ncbi:hypothetical protein [Streptomyces roseoverticillatus]|uniref:hypothetical protein n=1 Tax=Streptomyces roseoverticillatus TaxID=66429 RepID=UPI001F48C2B2|nr:hypothetical protein [Streptomyces roseoverticillatus]
MKLIVRTGLVAAAALGAVATAVIPASAAVVTDGPRPVAGAHAVTPNPKTIKAADYNQARSTLAKAGSKTAAKSHPVHGKTDVPVGHGTSLLAAARDEFRQTDKKLPPKDKRSDMSIDHYNAIHSAAKTMGIDTW